MDESPDRIEKITRDLVYVCQEEKNFSYQENLKGNSWWTTVFMSPSYPQAVDPVQTEIGRLLDYSVVSTLTTQRINRCLSPSQEEIKTQGSPLPPSPSPGGGGGGFLFLFKTVEDLFACCVYGNCVLAGSWNFGRNFNMGSKERVGRRKDWEERWWEKEKK